MRAAFIFFVTFLIGACASTPGPSDNPLADTAWEFRRIAIRSNDFFMLPNDEGVHKDQVLFGADSSISIRSCNTCSGFYAIEGNHIVINHMVCTRRACELDWIDLVRQIGDHATFRFDDDFLILEKIVAVDTTSLIFAPAPVLEEN